MAPPKLDPQIQTHLGWLGFTRPTGLVVSAPALVRAGAVLSRYDRTGQLLLHECTEESTLDPAEPPVPLIPDFRHFAERVLDWNFNPSAYAGTAEHPIPSELELNLPDYDDTLRPDFAVRELDPAEGAHPWQLLVRVLEPGADLDRVLHAADRLEASPHGRMERLLRGTGVPAGLLFNGCTLRLISAPPGESSGWLDFQVADMLQTAGRPIAAALRLLLSQQRLLSLPRTQRLAGLLEESRKFQNEVSERLAEQVLHALYDLLRGMQAANDATRGALLHDTLAEHPDQVYHSLLTVILRLVFLLFAEQRDMLPENEVFLRHYSLGGLYDRLREETALFPDTMDQRYGAWAQLLVLFRLVYDGSEAIAMPLPRRHGVLFDPDRFPFLEGRPTNTARQVNDRIDPPRVPDSTVFRALDKLLVLDGERISYRAFNVEQIGSVYETMMGFRLETAIGRSIAIKAPKPHGAPTTIDLDALLATPANHREKWLADQSGRKPSPKITQALKTAESIEDLHAALQPIIETAATPDLIPPGAMTLQPSEERRRSGSHYTPRALTEPIVRTTLQPVLARLRSSDDQPPTPDQILELKVCDPAMGSGAFLVEACRQLGDALVEAWHVHEQLPTLPPDEDEVVFARRIIAQRCLYGVDRNPVAVDLAKVSLWLVTLAREHALTFLDHALRHGDSLVGLTRDQLERFHWETADTPVLKGFPLRNALDSCTQLREFIREADDTIDDWELRDFWDMIQSELSKIRLRGDLVIAAFFEGKNQKEREQLRLEYMNSILQGNADTYRGRLEEWRNADPPLVPFHWEIEFPEVFARENSGFDAIVGNPPSAGKNSIAAGNPTGYLDWLKHSHKHAHGNSDLVAHFFRRTSNLLRQKAPSA